VRATVAGLLMVAGALSACAAQSLQIRPATSEPFIGNWEGAWYDSSGSTGLLDVVVKPSNEGVVWVLVRATNAIAPGFGGDATFVDGELILDRPTLRIILVFRLLDGDRLEASYRYRDRGNTGVWALTRRR
jgi:hypothetical protein